MLATVAGNDIVLAVIAFGIILIPAIIIHELGHFFAAKLVGINVLEFGIGFPPRLGRLFMWGETEFTLNLLPIGGFVRPLGEDMIGPAGHQKVKRDLETIHQRLQVERIPLTEREQLQVRGVDESRMMSVSEAPPLGRIFFMAAGALANFLTAIVLFFVVALIGLPTNVGGLSQIVSIPDGSLFSGTEVTAGDAIERVNGARFVDFERFYEILETYPTDEIEFSLLRHETGEPYSVKVSRRLGDHKAFVQVVAVEEESPAYAAGVQPGDLVTHINGLRIPSSGNPAAVLKVLIREYQGRELVLRLLRESEDDETRQIDVRIFPRVNPPEGVGRAGIAIRSQFGLEDNTRFANAGFITELIPQDLSSAIAHSLRTIANTFELIASIPGRLLDGSLSGKDARPISIIGISKIGGEFLQRSLQEGPGLILNFIALISIFLGVSNLLPIPALDGGRIVFVLLEIIRGRPVNPRVEARIHQVGIMLLLLLGVIIMIYDIVDPPVIS